MKFKSIWILSSLCIFSTVVNAGIFSNRAAPGPAVNANEQTGDAGSTDEKRRVDKKMDYKLSFKVPYLYGNEVPFWSVGGDAITSRDFIRLSPSIPGTKGWMWSNLENEYQDWMVEMSFRVSGNQIHGGRGMAFWYTKRRLPTGPIFGAQDQWDGLSIWFDTTNPKTRHPTVMAFLNDGKTSFASPGVDPTKRALGTCTIDYRNPTSFVKLRLTYKNKILTMMMDNTDRGRMPRPCFQIADISLPPGYFFGLTAASHNPADDHDIISFETFQLDPPPKKMKQKRPLEDEKIKQGEEFSELSEEQQKKIEMAEAEVRRLREHTDNTDLFAETVATMGVLFDTERRILETLQINQLQLEAMGAPTADKILSGDYTQKPSGQTQGGNRQTSNSVSVDDLRSETKLVMQRLEHEWQQRDSQLKSIQDTMSQMETLIQTMDKRMALQSNNLQGKLSEMTKDSAEAKGTMSTLIKYVLYACGLQALVGTGCYLYWKLRVEKTEKKFL